jgi:hypothetical protein
VPGGKMNFIEFWRETKIGKSPIIHQGDEGILSVENCNYRSYIQYANSAEFNDKKNQFHLGLIPVPFAGDINRADIFILLLNPGFSIINYYEEFEDKGLRRTLERNLYQDFSKCNYPFFCLDPQYLWTGGGQYWVSKLDSVINEVSHIRKCNYTTALHELANRIAVFELIPYHSKSYRLKKKVEDSLSSKNEMLNYVNSNLVTKAKKNKAIIIVTRKVSQWNLPDDNNIIKYNNSEARSAHLTANSRGGQAIIQLIKNKRFA